MIENNLIRNDIKPLTPDVSVSYALELMDEIKATHLPVVEDGHYLGLIS